MFYERNIDMSNKEFNLCKLEAVCIFFLLWIKEILVLKSLDYHSILKQNYLIKCKNSKQLNNKFI